MLSFDNALNTILETAQPLGQTTVALPKALHLALSQPVSSPFDLPRFDNSAMDGFGVRYADIANASEETPIKLPVTGVLQAGGQTSEITTGTAVKIMTGAPVPQSVDTVVMKEFCETQNGHVLVKKTGQPGDNIRRRGEEIKSGQQVLAAGTIITPAVIGMLATLGLSEVPVYQKPRIAILSTGNELVTPGNELQAGEIYDSNSFALTAACQAMGLDSIRTFHASDDRQSLSDNLNAALAESDVLITLGGVSVGDYDLVKSALETLGMQTRFWKINIKPGKPVLFGTFDKNKNEENKLVFGLPGNPVSALVTFELLVKPALEKMLGYNTLSSERSFSATLTETIRQRPGRRNFVRGIATIQNGQWQVTPTQGQDSHMMLGLARANCLIVFPEEIGELPQNSAVTIQLLN